ncbi:MAG TPA: hypothetical protein VER37_07350 [Thermomicrobiales bacterium]|nr:hypothetical protein [Thermomicrobiales bacterium]
MMTRPKWRTPIPIRNGLIGAAIGLAVAMFGWILFGDLVSLRDLVVGPVMGGTLMAGTAWLHLTAARGDWRRATWAAPAAVVFVGFALMAGNGSDNVAFGLIAGLLLTAWALWYVPRASANRRDA